MSDKPVITLPYSVVTVNQNSTFTPPGATVTAGVGDFYLNLDATTKSIVVTKSLPYEFTVNYKNGQSQIKAAFLNDSDLPTVQNQNQDWLYSSDSKLLFSSNKQILEV